jgi:N-succinyldiaminopimelate aminotransferase
MGAVSAAYGLSLVCMSAIPGAWRRTAAGAGLLSPDGIVAPTIFAEMSAAAVRTGAINLGQGFPDEDGPAEVLEAARSAIARGMNQYPPGRGNPELLAAIAEHQHRFYGLEVDPATSVIVTAGATEALTATLLALIDSPDDEVVVFAASVTDRTRIILVNDPHNPTGVVFAPEVQSEIVRLAESHDAVIVTDEVYEHLTFAGPHVPLATLPGAAERTLTISSAGKTFSTTGWKIGWVHGPAELITAVLTVKQYLTYVNGSPFQPAVAVGLRMPDSFFTDAADALRRKHAILGDGLRAAGFEVIPPQGGYFTVADATTVGGADAAAFCRALPAKAGVVAIPLSAFVSAEHQDDFAGLVRFAACKRVDVLEKAAARLAAASF